MQDYDEDYHINVGTGEDVTIKELTETIVDVVGYAGEIEIHLNQMALHVNFKC